MEKRQRTVVQRGLSFPRLIPKTHHAVVVQEINESMNQRINQITVRTKRWQLLESLRPDG